MDDYVEWHDLCSQIARVLHGKAIRCILPDDPNYYYDGRFSLQTSKGNDVDADFVIIGDVYPFKLECYTAAEDWLWDTFSFEHGIIRAYNGISVSGESTVTIIGSDMPVVPEITCSETMNVEFENQTFQLAKGINKNYDVILKEGENIMKFTGNGTVTIDFRGGIL